MLYVMSHAHPTPLPSETETSALTPAQSLEIVRSQAQTIETIKQQLEWFKQPPARSPKQVPPGLAKSTPHQYLYVASQPNTRPFFSTSFHPPEGMAARLAFCTATASSSRFFP
jgi:hypothetical protein